MPVDIARLVAPAELGCSSTERQPTTSPPILPLAMDHADTQTSHVEIRLAPTTVDIAAHRMQIDPSAFRGRLDSSRPPTSVDRIAQAGERRQRLRLAIAMNREVDVTMLARPLTHEAVNRTGHPASCEDTASGVQPASIRRHCASSRP